MSGQKKNRKTRNRENYIEKVNSIKDISIKKMILIMVAVIVLCEIVGWCRDNTGLRSGNAENSGSGNLFQQILSVLEGKRYTDKELEGIPEELVELLERNPETEDFVLNYTKNKDKEQEISLKEYEDCSEVPLFLQWDERWGYREYGDSMIALSGCGPTCLSMVCVYLLDDLSMNPAWMSEYSVENGFYNEDYGTEWALMSEGARNLGLDVTEIPLDEKRIIDNLEVGNPIICSMGPGDFTETGHFIVMVGYEDGKIKVNDPNSKSRSEKLWELDDIKSQIRNLWVYRN